MAVGTNLDYSNEILIQRKVMKLSTLGSRANVGKNSRHFCTKAGVPANNTAADNPTSKGDICFDTTNNDVYLCTAWTANASATTWVKIVD